jgi:hypothetical protein
MRSWRDVLQIACLKHKPVNMVLLESSVYGLFTIRRSLRCGFYLQHNRILQLQKRENPFRCQEMTVAGLTIIRADFQ